MNNQVPTYDIFFTEDDFGVNTTKLKRWTTTKTKAKSEARQLLKGGIPGRSSVLVVLRGDEDREVVYAAYLRYNNVITMGFRPEPTKARIGDQITFDKTDKRYLVCDVEEARDERGMRLKIRRIKDDGSIAGLERITYSNRCQFIEDEPYPISMICQDSKGEHVYDGMILSGRQLRAEIEKCLIPNDIFLVTIYAGHTRNWVMLKRAHRGIDGLAEESRAPIQRELFELGDIKVEVHGFEYGSMPCKAFAMLHRDHAGTFTADMATFIGAGPTPADAVIQFSRLLHAAHLKHTVVEVDDCQGDYSPKHSYYWKSRAESAESCLRDIINSMTGEERTAAIDRARQKLESIPSEK